MPVHRGRDSQGSYYQWGSRGAKYYYEPGNVQCRANAYRRALRQGQAAYAHGYRETQLRYS